MFKECVEDLIGATQKALKCYKEGDEIGSRRAKKEARRLATDIKLAKAWGYDEVDNDEPFQEIP